MGFSNALRVEARVHRLPFVGRLFCLSLHYLFFCATPEAVLKRFFRRHRLLLVMRIFPAGRKPVIAGEDERAIRTSLGAEGEGRREVGENMPQRCEQCPRLFLLLTAILNAVRRFLMTPCLLLRSGCHLFRALIRGCRRTSFPLSLQ